MAQFIGIGICSPVGTDKRRVCISQGIMLLVSASKSKSMSGMVEMGEEVVDIASEDRNGT